ncbi:uncharacterized protein LOC133460114 [Cololabis saira]|uniref:uncharacterized protein LOC133460114 n=1 Tax=Cololabis saira TaxID=129043 RepID=UPI002AD5A1CA|nr:uncharacterized protein LOC133460114 [Cololabis saira]
MMTLQRTRNCVKTSEPDLNYASLDLKKAKKRKKKHGNVQEQLQSRHQPQDRGAPPANVFLEVDADVEPHLPDRDASTMVSHSSIYLNSQQIAMETEEMQREQQDPGWEEEPGRGGCGGRGGWEGQETEERTVDPYGGSEDTCAPLSEAETIDLQTESFNDDNN